MESKPESGKKKQQSIIKTVFQGKKIYFNAKKERRFYFMLTLIMLILGIVYKLGLL